MLKWIGDLVIGLYIDILKIRRAIRRKREAREWTEHEDWSEKEGRTITTFYENRRKPGNVVYEYKPCNHDFPKLYDMRRSGSTVRCSKCKSVIAPFAGVSWAFDASHGDIPSLIGCFQKNDNYYVIREGLYTQEEFNEWESVRSPFG